MKKMTCRQIAVFFRQLSTLMNAHIPLIEACQLLGFDKNHRILWQLIQIIKRDIETGKSLSLCLQRFPQYFDLITCQMIELGEQTGTLPATLDRLATHHEKKDRLRRKIIQSLTYPLLVTGVAIITTVILLTVIVPRFVSLFDHSHTPLPSLTQWVIHLSEWMQSYSALLVLAGLTTLPIYLSTYHKAFFRHSIEIALLKGPCCTFFMKIALARFAHHLSLMIASSIPLPKALTQLGPLTGSVLYQKAILQCLSGVLRGYPLHIMLNKDRLFLPMVIHLIKIGEESGQLEAMLCRITHLYEADIEEEVLRIAALLEPLIMVILGALIGGLVIAMYLPIFQLGTAIQ